MKDIFSHLRISFVESAINAQMRALGGIASGDSIDLGLGSFFFFKMEYARRVPWPDEKLEISLVWPFYRFYRV